MGNEPIYENVPLPWAQEPGEARSRTSSIQSAPEMTRGTTSAPATATLPPKAPVSDTAGYNSFILLLSRTKSIE